MIRRLTIVPIILIVLGACTSAASPSPSASGAAVSSPSATTSGSATPSGTEPAATVPAASDGEVPTSEPVPSDELGAFTCELPIVEAATLPPPSNYVEVRVGEHDGYDRVVWEFAAGTPEFTLDRGEPPFAQDASGLPVEVEGESFLVLVMRGGTAMTESGESSYDGPRDFDPGLTALVDVVLGGDFEGQSTWFIGLNRESCVRVFPLFEPDRLVIDIEH